MFSSSGGDNTPMHKNVKSSERINQSHPANAMLIYYYHSILIAFKDKQITMNCYATQCGARVLDHWHLDMCAISTCVY